MSKTYYYFLIISGIVSLLIILIGGYTFLFVDNPKDKIIVNTEVSIFKLIDSLSASYSFERLLKHNDLVISTLQQREATAYSLRMDRESDIKQARTIYIALVVVLISLLLNKNKSLNLNRILILTVTIFISYLVEVHLFDLLQRQDESTQIISRSNEEIINSPYLSQIWYSLDYSDYLNQIKNASNGSVIRKLIRACHPDIEQFGIYILPFFYIFATFVICFYKQKNELMT